MRKLLLFGVVVLIIFLLLSLFFPASTTPETASNDIKNLTTELQNQYAEYASLLASAPDSTSSIPELPTQTPIPTKNRNRVTDNTNQLTNSHYYTFSAGTQKQYTLNITPGTSSTCITITYYPQTETYTKGYTDVNTKQWKEVTRTIPSPQSRAEITITDQTGRVIQKCGFGGRYSSELTQTYTLLSSDPHTITLSGNLISLTLAITPL